MKVYVSAIGMVESIFFHEHVLLIVSGLLFPCLNSIVAQERKPHEEVYIRFSPWSLLSFFYLFI